MRTRDPGWDNLATTIEQALNANARDDAVNDELPTTYAELARRLHVDAEEVRNWVRGRANPRLELIPAIGRELGLGRSDKAPWNPLALPEAMGVLSPVESSMVPQLAMSVHRLSSRLTQLQADIASVGTSIGAAAIVKQAVDNGDWAVAVWPAIEGPADCSLHVADRIDFRRVDGKPITWQEVWASFETVLRGVGAIRATSEPRWRVGDDPRVSPWAIPIVGAPRASTVMTPWRGLTSVAVAAVTTQSWANDLASHLADAIGYGQTSTRAQAMDIYGLYEGLDADRQRSLLHTYLLDHPQAKRVWSHWSIFQSPLPRADLPLDVGMVWIHESDDLLRMASETAGPSSYPHLTKDELYAEMRHARDIGDEVASRVRGVIRVDAVLPPAIRRLSVDKRRDWRWNQCLEQTAAVLDSLDAQNVLRRSAVVRMWDKDSDRSTKRVSAVRNWLNSVRPTAPTRGTASAPR